MDKLTGNLDLMREMNTKHILQALRIHAPISRSEIVEKTNLTAATVSRIISKLIKNDLITEVGYGESQGGRKPVLLNFNPGSLLTVGIDIEIDEVSGVIIDLSGKILAEKSVPNMGNVTEDNILKLVKDLIHYLLNIEDYFNKTIGIGIGMHGIVDYENGISIFPPAFDWSDVPIVEIIQNEFDFPVILENNVRSLTLGENWFGAARNLRDFICLKVGAGIGSGIFTNGKLFRGTSNSAGEIGHTMVDEDGPLCTCGNYGCLESMASVPAIVRRTKKIIKQGANTSLYDITDGNINQLEAKNVYYAALQQDQLARQILQDTGRYLGIGIANLINILNPEAVIVSGEMMDVGKIVLESLKATVNKRSLSYPCKHVKIINSELGKEGVAIGAAALILERVFKVDLDYNNLNLNLKV